MQAKMQNNFAYDYGESAEQLAINSSDDYDDVKQLTISMEEELKKGKWLINAEKKSAPI